MNQEKKQLLKLLDKIGEKQKEISECQTYYQSLEHFIEKKRKGNTNPEEMNDLMNEVSILNQEFEAKTDILYEDLNEILTKGHDLAKKIGHEIAHDFNKLWDYMTNSAKHNVKFERVLSDIDYIKQNFLS